MKRDRRREGGTGRDGLGAVGRNWEGQGAVGRDWERLEGTG